MKENPSYKYWNSFIWLKNYSKFVHHFNFLTCITVKIYRNIKYNSNEKRQDDFKSYPTSSFYSTNTYFPLYSS